MRDQTRSLERSIWKAPAICCGVEEALFPHHVFEKRELTLVDEQHQLAGLREVGLRRQQRDRFQPVVAVARHRRSGDRQQRAAEAIADGMYLLVRARSRRTASSAAMTPSVR